MITLNFHRIEPPTGLEITRISPARFRRLLHEVEDPASGAVNITFDDGFNSVAQNAFPELESRRLTSTVFLVTDAVGRTDRWDVRILGRSRPMMSWNTAREWASRGVSFGSHTRSHRDLTALNRHELREELVSSKQAIEDHLGVAVSGMSYPFGRHDERVREAVRAAGYEKAYAVGGAHGDRFAIPRTNVYTLTSVVELRRLLRHGKAPNWRTRLFSSLSAGTATVSNWKRNRIETESYVRTRSATDPDHEDRALNLREI